MRKKRFTSLEIWQQEPGRYMVTGNLTFAGIDKEAARNFPFLQGGGPVVLDFSEVNKTDSAGLALLVEWIKCAKQQHIVLRFEHIPGQLLKLAELTGFERMLSGFTTLSATNSNPI